MSRSPNDKITEDEGRLLTSLVGKADVPAACPWKPVLVHNLRTYRGLVECGLAEFQDMDEDSVRATTEGWARVQAVKAGQIGYELGKQMAAESAHRPRVVVESPYAGDVERNEMYLKCAMLDCICRGEAPFASHMLYTQFLNDDYPDDRKVGIECGFAWGALATRCVVYADFGITPGMIKGLSHYSDLGIHVEEVRHLPKFVELVERLERVPVDGMPSWNEVRKAVFVSTQKQLEEQARAFE